MTDYKVNLPKTDFPMRADLAKREPKMLELWQKEGIYQKTCKKNCVKNQSVNKTKPAKTFVLHDGPPYANGEIHLGHAANKILKDIIMKARMLDGYATPYIPGWDCHGLPIELNVEKKFGRAGDKISKEEFMCKCREYAGQQVDLQREAFQRLGVLGDWENPYLTMDKKYEADIIRALGKIIENGYIGRGFKPVHWCTACGSALAEAEVEYMDKESPAIDVRFRFVDSEKFFKEKFGLDGIKNASIPIWTTTPWTLPANEAVCLHAEMEYALIAVASAEYLLVAANLAEGIANRYGVQANFVVKHKCVGKDLEGILLQHPFLNKKVPIILGEHVTDDSGTGAVHTAPAHGLDDYKVGLKYKLLVNNPVDPNGRFLPDTEFTREFPEFAGAKVFDANEKILDLLRERGNLIHAEKITHSYPHCWRHKKPLIFRATGQWFMFMDIVGANPCGCPSGKNLRQIALEAIENIAWLAPHGKERIQEMVGNRPDWCISRQRVWGTPIALFVHKKTGELHPNWQYLLEQVAIGVEHEGIEFWQKLDVQKFLAQHAVGADLRVCPPSEHVHLSSELDPTKYEKTSDTLDVWFDSGVSHYCFFQKYVKNNSFEINELKNEVNEFHEESGSVEHLVADLYIEGSDQYRGWFQSSLLTALAIDGKAPFKEVASHGFTVDGAGRKMSKSVGNVISPQKITDTLGADILRLWAASLYMYDDLPVSDEILARCVDIYREFRNTARFLLGNLYDFDPATNLVASGNMVKLDLAIVQGVLHSARSAKHDYEHYSLHSISLSYVDEWYFSIIKDRLYTMAPASHGRRSAQTALYHILEILVRIAAPILSFTAEEIWQEMRELWKKNNEREESVFLDKWYDDCGIAPEFHGAGTFWNRVQIARGEVNKLIEKHRAVGEIGSSLEAEVILYCDEEQLDLSKLDDELKFILITSSASVKPLAAADERAATTDVPWLKVTVTKSPHPKCPRCWHRRADIGSNPKYPELCARCAGNLSDNWEPRHYA